MKFVVFLVFISACFIKVCLNKMQKTVNMDRIEICELPPSSPFIIGEVVIVVLNHCTLVNANFEVTREIKRIKGVSKVTRCSNKELLDSCAYFTTIKIENTCPLLNQKGTIVSSMIYACNPPATCPFRKGRYVLTNGTFNPNYVQFFPLDKWYWKIKMEAYDSDTNEHLLTLCVEGQVVSYYL